ncbi:MAG: response regulator transcription factor [Pseudomonadaceae bacterium]|nr:response regulator transcription factor [Pseudomonadaceae bacterium]
MVSKINSACVEVVLVEDDKTQRVALGEELTEFPGWLLAGSAETLAQARELGVKAGQWWLIDLGLPDGDGVELIPNIVDAGAQALVLSVFGDEAHVLAALRAGACGYLVKGEQALSTGLSQAIEGYAPLSASVAGYLVDALRRDDQLSSKPKGTASPPLSPREMETLDALSRGYTYREIAQLHSVSYHTVGDHVKSIYRKLAVSSKAQAVHRGLLMGLVSVDDSL